MASDLISKKTRYEFREYWVGTTLREIEQAFDSAEIAIGEDYVPSLSGQRRSLVEQYYHTIDWTKWSDVRKFVAAYEDVLTTLELSGHPPDGSEGNEWARSHFASLKKWIERDGFIYSDGRLVPRADVALLPDVAEAARHFDAPELRRQVERIRNAVDDDPALAIGTAKELVETTCKTILDDREVAYADNADVVDLVKATRKVLGLLPEDIPEFAKGAQVIRRLLSNLGTVAQGLSELRNLYGTGHGRGRDARGLGPRHARLAVGAASTLATFLFETHQDRE